MTAKRNIIREISANLSQIRYCIATLYSRCVYVLGWMVFGVVSSLYVNTGNPYSDGKLGVKNVTLDRTSTAPMHMTG